MLLAMEKTLVYQFKMLCIHCVLTRVLTRNAFKTAAGIRIVPSSYPSTYFSAFPQNLGLQMYYFTFWEWRADIVNDKKIIQFNEYVPISWNLVKSSGHQTPFQSCFFQLSINNNIKLNTIKTCKVGRTLWSDIPRPQNFVWRRCSRNKRP